MCFILQLCSYTGLCTTGKSAKQGAGSGSQEGGSTAAKSEATKQQKQALAAPSAAASAALAAAAAAMQQSSSSTDAALQTRLGRLQLATQLVRAVLESDVDSPKKVDTMSKIVLQSLADADLLTAAAAGTSTATATAAASATATVEEAAAAGAAAVGSSTDGFSELQQQVHKLRLRISQMHHVLSSGDSCDAKLQWLSASVQL
jgi:trimeric autotransporter adhesin